MIAVGLADSDEIKVFWDSWEVPWLASLSTIVCCRLPRSQHRRRRKHRQLASQHRWCPPDVLRCCLHPSRWALQEHSLIWQFPRPLSRCRARCAESVSRPFTWMTTSSCRSFLAMLATRCLVPWVGQSHRNWHRSCGCEICDRAAPRQQRRRRIRWQRALHQT